MCVPYGSESQQCDSLMLGKSRELIGNTPKNSSCVVLCSNSSGWWKIFSRFAQDTRPHNDENSGGCGYTESIPYFSFADKRHFFLLLALLACMYPWNTLLFGHVFSAWGRYELLSLTHRCGKTISHREKSSNKQEVGIPELRAKKVNIRWSHPAWTGAVCSAFFAPRKKSDYC